MPHYWQLTTRPDVQKPLKQPPLFPNMSYMFVPQHIVFVLYVSWSQDGTGAAPCFPCPKVPPDNANRPFSSKYFQSKDTSWPCKNYVVLIKIFSIQRYGLTMQKGYNISNPQVRPDSARRVQSAEWADRWGHAHCDFYISIYFTSQITKKET